MSDDNKPEESEEERLEREYYEERIKINKNLLNQLLKLKEEQKEDDDNS